LRSNYTAHIPAKRFNPGLRRRSRISADSQTISSILTGSGWSGPGEFIHEPLDESGQDQAEFDANVQGGRF